MPSIHGKRLTLERAGTLAIRDRGYLRVDDDPTGPPINVAATAVGNSATATEETLKTYSLPARTLAGTNQGIYVRAYGAFAANAQNKRATLYVGGVSITTGSLTVSGSAWMLEAKYIKTGASTQRSITGGQYGATLLALATTTDTSTDTSAITIALKATSGSGSASDILCNALEVGFL